MAGPATLWGVFEEQVARAPSRVAVVGETGAMTYAELQARANAIAGHLLSLGAEPGGRVAIRLERSIDLPAAILGTLGAGCACVCVDPATPPARLRAILDDAAVSIVVEGALPTLGDVRPVERPRMDAEAAAFVFYTTGSTGEPKGVVISHAARLDRLRWEVSAYRLGPDDATLVKSSVGFARIVKELFWPLACGGRAVLAPPGSQLDLDHLGRLVERERVSVAIMVPSQLAVLAEAPDVAPWRSVRLFLAEGEPLTPAVYNRFVARFPSTLYNAYGLTEVSTVAVWMPSNLEPVDRVPIGKPARLEIMVVDDSLEPVPDGAPGELLVGGPIATEYLGRPGFTAERFVGDPRMFRTGDRVRQLEDGNLEHLGRLDSLLKIRGFRVEPAEVEQALERHPAVRRAVVVVRDVGDWRQLVAYVESGGGAGPPAAELRDLAKRWLPDYAIPARFVYLAALPLTANGKVDRSALPEPDAARPLPTETYVAPRDDTERALAALWSDVLDVDRVGLDDDFFILGGDSLAAATVFSALPEKLGVRLPLGALIDAPTIARLADKVRRRSSAAARNILVALSTEGALPPLFLVHGLYGNVLCFRALAQALAPSQPVYALQAIGLTGEETPRDRVEDLAARYLAELEAVLPDGPILLAGYSFGGMVAWEMASRLLASGRDVGLVALVDAVSSMVHQSVAPFLHSVPIRVQRADGRGEEHFALDVFVSSPRGSTEPEAWALRPISSDAHFAAVARAALTATRRYLPPRLDARVALLRARGGSSRLAYELRYGWGSLVDGSFCVHDVPGDHATILSPPWVASLAAALRREIDLVLAR